MSKRKKSVCRCSSTTRAYCYADEQLFLPWEEMNEKSRLEFTLNGPIPCEGGGVPGFWCEACRFGHI